MNDEAAEKGEEQAARTGRFVVPGAGVALVRQETVVLLVDLVESVRLMREHEAFTVRRWADFVGGHYRDTAALSRCAGEESG